MYWPKFISGGNLLIFLTTEWSAYSSKDGILPYSRPSASGQLQPTPLSGKECPYCARMYSTFPIVLISNLLCPLLIVESDSLTIFSLQIKFRGRPNRFLFIFFFVFEIEIPVSPPIFAYLHLFFHNFSTEASALAYLIADIRRETLGLCSCSLRKQP